MINNLFKIIHNRYSNFFRFIFFLRYLFSIFFIFIILFLTIPNLFNYEKKEEIIKKSLYKEYGFKINNIDEIKFRPLPKPNLELKNVTIKNDNLFEKFEVQSFKLFPKLFSIYNYEKFQINKIALKDNNIILDIQNFKLITNKFFNQKKKLSFNNLNIKIVDKKKTILNLKKIKFSNYGYNSNFITGEIFDKKFKVEKDKNYENLNFKLINSGVNAKIKIDLNNREKSTKGIFKANILNTNVKFNFDINDQNFKIYNSFVRNKYLTLENESLIIIKPYLEINSKFDIEELNKELFKKFNLDNLELYKNFIQKLNGKNEINFKSRRLSRDLIEDLNIKIQLAYGRLDYSKKFLISENVFQCKGNLNLLEDFPSIFFDCSIILKDAAKFLKIFSIKNKSKNQLLEIDVVGNLSILNKKIKFKSISMDSYIASKEDLNYFSDTFFNIFLEKNFLEIFSRKKIKEFILEIS